MMTIKKQSPAFQFYADDFVGGTVDLSPSDVGAYIRLLCYQWGRGAIPTDRKAINRIAGCPVSPEVLAKFPNGVNERLEKVRVEQAEYRQNRSESGKKGASQRWHGHVTAIAQPLANPMSNPMANDDSPSPTPTPLSKLTTKGGLKALDAFEWEIAGRYEKALGDQWVNDAGKWVNRIARAGSASYGKAVRVIAEVESAIKESRITTSPAQYAEQTWKEFQ